MDTYVKINGTVKNLRQRKIYVNVKIADIVQNYVNVKNLRQRKINVNV